jgi:hypothetical protein
VLIQWGKRPSRRASTSYGDDHDERRAGPTISAVVHQRRRCPTFSSFLTKFASWPSAALVGNGFTLSPFRIGWDNLDVGKWTARLGLRDHAPGSKGWVCPPAGFQSSVTVYPLARWTLTYFGLIVTNKASDHRSDG